MKKINLELINKYNKLLALVKRYFELGAWLSQFDAEPIATIDKMIEACPELGAEFKDVQLGLNTENIKEQAMGIANKLFKSKMNDLSKEIKELLLDASKSDYNPLSVIADNGKDMMNMLDKELAVQRLKNINSSLPMREFAVKRLDIVLNTIAGTGISDNVDNKVWFNRLVETISNNRNIVSDVVEDKFKLVNQSNVFIKSKLSLIESNIKSETLVVDAPEAENKEIVLPNTDNEEKLSSYVVSTTDTAVSLLENLSVLSDKTIEAKEHFSSFKIPSYDLSENELVNLLEIADAKTDEYANGGMTTDAYAKYVTQLEYLATLPVYKLEVFITELINESIRLNRSVDMYSKTAAALEDMLTKASIA